MPPLSEAEKKNTAVSERVAAVIDGQPTEIETLISCQESSS